MKAVYIAEGTQEEGILSIFKVFTGLTAKEIKILTLLVNNNGMIVANLAEVTGFDYTTIREILRSLRDKGLVKSSPEKPVCAELIPTSEVA
ncbi:MAG: MarR family transcriptional regulator [Theionarchaea archaeon]|nr:MarR family transcriptional regulator [Theionarchaea archaeon]